MTAQIGENIIYKDKKYVMCTEPLSNFFNLSGISIEFCEPLTALWCGYIGTWEIKENRLYLISIEGNLKNDKEVVLEDIFPGYPDRVFAHWYSGLLRIPDGKMLSYEHMGYASEYERDILITIEKGVVQKTKVRQNGISEDKNAPQGYGVAAFTTLTDKGENKE